MLCWVAMFAMFAYLYPIVRGEPARLPPRAMHIATPVYITVSSSDEHRGSCRRHTILRTKSGSPVAELLGGPADEEPVCIASRQWTA